MARTGQQCILNTLSGRRLRWLGHTIRMDHRRITQYTSSTILGGPRFQEGTRSAKGKLERYSQERSARNGTSWEQTEVAALNGQEWRRSVAQYVHVDEGCIKSSQVLSAVLTQLDENLTRVGIQANAKRDFFAMVYNTVAWRWMRRETACSLSQETSKLQLRGRSIEARAV